LDVGRGKERKKSPTGRKKKKKGSLIGRRELCGRSYIIQKTEDGPGGAARVGGRRSYALGRQRLSARDSVAER